MKLRNLAFLILSINSCLHKEAFSQRTISVAPQLSYESIQNYVIENVTSPTFRAYNRHFSPSYGLNIQLEFKGQWMYFAGWSISSPVLGYKYMATGPNLWRKTGLQSHRFLFGIQKTLGRHHLFKYNKNNRIVKVIETLFGDQQPASNRYFLLFRSKIISGISYDLLHSMPGDLTNNGENVSILVGLGIQFFNLRQDHLQINLIYSHGVNEVTQSKVRHFYNNKEYIASMGSRGSYFGFQFLYPIRLFDDSE